jgi:hypothetical protein
MALPPEPLEDVLPYAPRIFVGEVVKVEDLGAWPSTGGAIDAAPARPAQRAQVRVFRMLRGPMPSMSELWVVKPQGAYALHAGVRGPFLVDAVATEANLLGRYGPDTWSEEEIDAALAGEAQR